VASTDAEKLGDDLKKWVVMTGYLGWWWKRRVSPGKAMSFATSERAS
jgi:hypothetical protein